MPPREFARRATRTVDVQQAPSILLVMGFHLPSAIADYASLSFALNLPPRLSDDQIEEFVRRTTGTVP
jgi:hypothetical protein